MYYKIEFPLLNNLQIDIYPQFKVNDKFTTDLDAFEFTTNTINYELDIDLKKYNGLFPMILKANGEDFKIMYLSSYRRNKITYNPNKYQYIIQGVSPTLLFQRITLPNKLITQVITDEKRSVWQELKKIMEVYAPEIIIDLRLQQLLNRPCPELQFVKSTLHEILITLFAVCGLVPKAEYLGELSYIDLKSDADVVNWNSEDIFIRDEKSNSIENYADALDFDIENAISNEEDITTQWLAPTSEDVLISTDNFVWKTPSDIYEIIKVEAFLDVYYSIIPEQPSTESVIVDITRYVVPKEIWETFKTSSSSSYISGQYKRNYLYYDKDVINGNFEEGNWLGFSMYKAIKNAIYWSLKSNPLIDFIDMNVSSSYRDILLRVTYKTNAGGIRVKVVKEGIEKPINNLISNQDESFIDIINFGNQKQEFINKIGNELWLGQAYFKLDKINSINELNIPKLGDRVDNDYIITQREMQFQENDLMINYYLAKHYEYLTGYSGLNQVKRFTSIDTQNTVVRNDNFLYSFRLDTKEEQPTTIFTNDMLNGYGGLSENGKMLHLIQTINENNTYLQDYYILATSQNKKIADSIVCSIQFETNVKVGDAVNKDGNIYLKEPIKYTDNNGEFKYLNFYFNQGESLRDEMNYDIVSKFPKVEHLPEDLPHERYLLNKDNREITSISLQFRFLGNNKDVFVYNDFAKYINILPHQSAGLKLFSNWFEDEEEFNLNKYNQNTLFPLGNERSYFRINFENNKISIGGVTTEYGYYTIGVCDSNNNLLFAINYTNSLGSSTIDLFLNEIN